MTYRTAHIFSAALVVVLSIACGGGDSEGAASPSSSAAAGSAGSSGANKSCSGPSDCGPGYQCTAIALSLPKSPAPCTIDVCMAKCGEDPECTVACLQSDCSTTGAAGSTGTSGCSSYCSQVSAKCGAAAGQACGLQCPQLPASCLTCVLAGDLCDPSACLSSTACGGGGPGAGGATGAGGSTSSGHVCTPLPGAGGSSAGGSTGAGGTTAATMKWAGTWSITLDYDILCTAGASGAKHPGHASHTLTMPIAGENASLSATPADGYELTGFGDASSLTLSGKFPLRDHNGKTAATSSLTDGNNEVTIKIDEVASAKSATGVVSGKFPSDFVSCVVSNGKVTLSR